MALKLVVDTIEGLSEEVQKLYAKKDDNKYHLDVDNPYKDKVDEFRTNNVNLLKEKEKLVSDLAKFKDIDPTQAKEALKKLQEMADEKLIGEGKIEELLTQRTERMKQDHANQIKALTDKAAENEGIVKGLKSKLSVVTIDNAIQLEVSKAMKPAPGALPDILSRGRNVFSLDDKGEVVALDDKGGLRYSKDGTTPLNIQEWANNLYVEAPHLFEKSAGAGSAGGGNGQAGGKKVISRSDSKGFSDNLEKIAKGEVVVQ